MAVPFLYYGIQIVAAPYFPDYSFASQAASLLGSERSTHPSIFNVGVIATGIATLLAAAGFFRALWRLGANPILTWITSIALAGTAISTLWAGYFLLLDREATSGHPAIAHRHDSIAVSLNCRLVERSGRANTEGLSRCQHPAPDRDDTDHVGNGTGLGQLSSYSGSGFSSESLHSLSFRPSPYLPSFWHNELYISAMTKTGRLQSGQPEAQQWGHIY